MARYIHAMSNIEMPRPAGGRRGRPPKPEQTRETEAAILGAATTLFIEHGFANTKMDDIARRAAVAKGTLYKYFPNKTGLLEAVLDEVIARPLAAISALPVPQGESIQAFLRHTLLPWMRTGKTPQLEGMLRLIVSEASRFPEMAAVYRRAVLDPMTAFLTRLAAAARMGGELRSNSDGLERFPLLLMTPALMATAWNGLHNPQDQLDAGSAFEALLDLLFKEE